MGKSISQKFGKLLKSRISGRIIEITGIRSDGLIRKVVEYFGDDVLFVITVRGYEVLLKDKFLNVGLYTLSENYFKLRLNIKTMKDLLKLVKQLANELISEMKTSKFDTVVLYRANDLPPFILGMDQNLVEEEFWRILTMDLRSIEGTFMFVYEKIDYRPDILSQFVDTIINMTHPPQVWSVLE